MMRGILRQTDIKLGYSVIMVLLLQILGTGSRAQNADITEHLRSADSLALSNIREGKTAGLSMIIVKDGKVILSKGYGFADLENRIPASSATIYPIASITKQFTAVSILQLAEEGRIHLEDSLSHYVAGYADRSYNITIHQLLNHTSGVKNITSLGSKYWGQVGNIVTKEDLIKMFIDEPLDFGPGEDYSYNNSDYILLGAIIEKASGLNYGEYLKKNIFTKYGLKNTFYYPDLKDSLRSARLYSHGKEGFQPAVYVNPTQGYSMGGIVSTTEDMARWLMLLHSGEIIGSLAYKKMITPGTLSNGEKISYGYGVGVGEFAGHKLLFHAGGIFGADAQSVYFPEDKLIIVILANTDDADVVGLENRITKNFLNISEIPEVKLDRKSKIKFTGTYKFRSSEIKVILKSDSLYISGLWGNDPVKIRYIGDETFKATEQIEEVKFILNEG
ncbi:MAG: serine hydrolase domain-containing protein, partial [Bacillota bacterium]